MRHIDASRQPANLLERPQGRVYQVALCHLLPGGLGMKIFRTARSRLGIISGAVVLAIVPMLAAPATAEDQAGNWAEVTNAADSCARWNPMREGYYRFSDDQGWGYWKITQKHWIYNTMVWRHTINASCPGPDGSSQTTFVYRLGFVYRICDQYGNNCVDQDSVIVRTVVQRAMFNGLRKGAITEYCEGIQGYCPAWLDAYDGDSVYSRKAVSAVDGQEVQVSTFTPPPLKARSAEAATGLPPQALSQAKGAVTRAGEVLTQLDADLRSLTRELDVEIVEARQAAPDTVEVIYRYPGFDGLVGLRRDVSARPVELKPTDKQYALAVNENSPREIATMLRIQLEEPQRFDTLVAGTDGIYWWGD